MSSPTPKPSVASWTGWAVAAILSVVASYFGAVSFSTRAQLLVQKDQTDLNALELRSLHQSIEANRILNDRQMADLQHGSTLDALKVATLSATESGAHDLEAVAVWDPITQEGVLSIRSLPQLGSDQNYQLWLMTADEKVSASGGVFAVNDQGQAHIHFHLEHPIEAARVTITRERLGGAPAPSNPIVATGSF